MVWFLGNTTGHQYSAMAQTVGYPCAIAAHLVLEGRLSAFAVF